jgi:hypothetical protein
LLWNLLGQCKICFGSSFLPKMNNTLIDNWTLQTGLQF